MADERDVPGKVDDAINDALYIGLRNLTEDHPFREWGFKVDDEFGVWWYRGRCEVTLDPLGGDLMLYIELPNGYTIKGEIKPETLEGMLPRNLLRFRRPQ
jgi:hypothetical protein